MINLKEKHEFKFGNAGRLSTNRAVVIPACIGGRLVALKAAVLPAAGAETPLLLSKECLSLKATLDMENDVLYVGKLGARIALKETERGHYAIPILGLPSRTFKDGNVQKMANEVHAVTEANFAATVSTKPVEPEPSGQEPVPVDHGKQQDGRDGDERADGHAMEVRHDGHATDARIGGGPEAGSGGRVGNVNSDQDSRCSRGSRRRRAKRARKGHGADVHREICQGRRDQGLQDHLCGGQRLCPVDQKIRQDDKTQFQGTGTDDTNAENAAVCGVSRSAQRPANSPRAAGAAGDRCPGLPVHRPFQGGDRDGGQDQGNEADEATRRFQQWLLELGGGDNAGTGKPNGQDRAGQGASQDEGGVDGKDASAPDGTRGIGEGGMSTTAEINVTRGEPGELSSVMTKSEKQLCRQGLCVIGEHPGKSLGQVSGDVGSKLDLLELFSGEAERNAQKVGLEASHVLRNGQKFERHHRYFGSQLKKEVLRQLSELKPRMFVCTMPVALRAMHVGQYNADRLYCRSYSELVCALSSYQDSQGGLFAIEVGRQVEGLESVLRRDGVTCVNMPGLQTMWVTNCREFVERVKRAESSAEKRKEGESESQMKLRVAGNMCVASVLDWKRAKEIVVTRTCVHAVEDLRSGEGLNDRQVMMLIRRCHENLGHPSSARMNMLLKAAHASERVLRLAKGLTCEVCDAVVKPRSHNVTKIRRATEFNQQVCLDTFELEVRGSRLYFLNIVDEGTSYQLCVPLWKGKQAKHVRNAYRKAWKRWAGAPIRVFTDGGPEFEAEFEHGLGLDGSFGDKAAAYAPWQNGLTERKGGVWKMAFQKAALDAVPRSKQEVQELIDNVNVAVNTMTRKDGYSPCQHVFGRELRVPGLVTTEYDPVINSGLVQGESIFERRMAFRTAARKAFLEADGDSRIRAALEHRTRPERGPFVAGNLVYFWRRHRYENKHHWHGPAVVVGSQGGSKIWIAAGTKVYRCCPEQLRKLSPDQEAMIRLLPADVVHVRSEVSARGAGAAWDLADEHVGQEEQSSRPSAGDVVMEEDSGAQPNAPNVEGVEQDVREHVLPVERARERVLPVERVREEQPVGDESPLKRVRVMEHVSDLTSALRRSPEQLDGTSTSGAASLDARNVPVPVDTDEELEVCVAEAKRVSVERTKGRKEVAMSSVASERKPGLEKAKLKEWKKLLDSGAIIVHKGREAKRLREKYARNGRFMKSRFVITEAEGQANEAAMGLKARWCIRGYLDPALLELDTNAPTLSAEGFATVVQLLASKRWDIQIADVEGAFLRGDKLDESRGRLFIEMPPGGIEGYDNDCVIEAVKTVYGLADAPKAWWKSFSAVLVRLGMKVSSFDPCVFWFYHEGRISGAIALHVDDMCLGGDQLKKVYPLIELVRKGAADCCDRLQASLRSRTQLHSEHQG